MSEQIEKEEPQFPTPASGISLHKVSFELTETGIEAMRPFSQDVVPDLPQITATEKIIFNSPEIQSQFFEKKT